MISERLIARLHVTQRKKAVQFLNQVVNNFRGRSVLIQTSTAVWWSPGAQNSGVRTDLSGSDESGLDVPVEVAHNQLCVPSFPSLM